MTMLGRLMLLLAPFCLCGPLRAATSLPLWAALGLGVVVTLIGWVMLRDPKRMPATRRETLVRASIICAPALVAAALLWNRHLGPLTSWIGSDGGIHAAFLKQFEGKPRVYNGFVGLYGFAWWVERIFRVSTYWSLTVAFYLAVALVVAMPSVILQARPLRRRLMAMGVGLVVFVGVVLPLLHYHQMDGFYGQVWGLVPLVFMWLADTRELPETRRFALFAAGVVVCRFTYGIVLGDLLIAGTILCAARALGRPRLAARANLALGAAALAQLVAAAYFHRQLAPIIPGYGWIVGHDLGLAGLAEILAAAALGVVLVTAASARAALRFPVAVGVANAITMVVFRRLYPSEPYYLMKYDFHGVVLLCCALVVAVGSCPAPENGRARLLYVVAGASAVGALLLFWRAYAPLRPSYWQRAFASGDFTAVRPQADLEAWRRIDERLRSTKKQFGGYLIPFGPIFNFMNAAFGRYDGGYFAYRGPVSAPGHCVFWDRTADPMWADWARDGKYFVRTQVFEAQPDKECRSYRPTWSASGTRTLCSACF